MCQINNNFYTVNPGSTIIVMIQENLKFRIDCVPRETLYHLQLLTTIVFIFNFKPAKFFPSKWWGTWVNYYFVFVSILSFFSCFLSRFSYITIYLYTWIIEFLALMQVICQTFLYLYKLTLLRAIFWLSFLFCNVAILANSS